MGGKKFQFFGNVNNLFNKNPPQYAIAAINLGGNPYDYVGRITSYPAQGRAVEKVFWKIEAYDRDLRFGSEDPANPAVTRRVLTIMLASEY